MSNNVLKQQLDMKSIIQIAKENNLSFDSVKQIVQSYFKIDSTDNIMQEEDFFKKITTPDAVAGFCRNKNENLDVETAHFIVLNDNQELIHSFAIKGEERYVELDPPKIMRQILMKSDARFVIISHNHPSGIVTPSDADVSSSRSIKEMLKPFGIDLIDSVIYSERSYYSFTKSELLLDPIYEWGIENLEKQRSLDKFAIQSIEQHPGYSIRHSDDTFQTFTILNGDRNVIATNVDVFDEDIDTLISNYESKKKFDSNDFDDNFNVPKMKKSRSLSM